MLYLVEHDQSVCMTSHMKVLLLKIIDQQGEPTKNKTIQTEILEADFEIFEIFKIKY